MTAVYRIRQGLRAIFAFTQVVEVPLAAQFLTPELLDLFLQMRRGEQLHSLNVLREVLAQGAVPRDLAAAALLHDVGKLRYPLRTWQKTLAVLTKAIAPRLADRLGKGGTVNWWNRPFVVYQQHPSWGAALVRDAGASDMVVWLVGQHQAASETWADHPLAPLLHRLQQADSRH
jgi:hypothetical protein